MALATQTAIVVVLKSIKIPLAYVGIKIKISEIKPTVTEGINAALETDAFARCMAMAAQAVIPETQKATLYAQYAPASGQGNPLPQSGENH